MENKFYLIGAGVGVGIAAIAGVAGYYSGKARASVGKAELDSAYIKGAKSGFRGAIYDMMDAAEEGIISKEVENKLSDKIRGSREEFIANFDGFAK